MGNALLLAAVLLSLLVTVEHYVSRDATQIEVLQIKRKRPGNDVCRLTFNPVMIEST